MSSPWFILEPNPLKARLPGKGESQPAVGEGGRPFEPGRVRDDLVLRARWESANTTGSCRIPDGRLCVSLPVFEVTL